MSLPYLAWLVHCRIIFLFGKRFCSLIIFCRFVIDPISATKKIGKINNPAQENLFIDMTLPSQNLTVRKGMYYLNISYIYTMVG